MKICVVVHIIILIIGVFHSQDGPDATHSSANLTCCDGLERQSFLSRKSYQVTCDLQTIRSNPKTSEGLGNHCNL